MGVECSGLTSAHQGRPRQSSRCWGGPATATAVPRRSNSPTARGWCRRSQRPAHHPPIQWTTVGGSLSGGGAGATAPLRPHPGQRTRPPPTAAFAALESRSIGSRARGSGAQNVQKCELRCMPGELTSKGGRGRAGQVKHAVAKADWRGDIYELDSVGLRPACESGRRREGFWRTVK